MLVARERRDAVASYQSMRREREKHERLLNMGDGEDQEEQEEGEPPALLRPPARRRPPALPRGLLFSRPVVRLGPRHDRLVSSLSQRAPQGLRDSLCEFTVCFFVLCNRHWFNRAPGLGSPSQHRGSGETWVTVS